MSAFAPPKDGLVRALAPNDIELRAASEGGMPKLYGYMMRFNEWTEIDSIFEGRFLERIAPGAAKKSLAENRSMRILFNHGRDPHVGEKPLAEPRLVEVGEGLRYDEPELFDTTYNRDLVPGLEGGQYGSSFKFRSVREEIDEEPERSDYNPDGIPERTVTELKLYEGGPVTFPAYEGSVTGARSLTDHFFIDALKADPTRSQELDDLFAAWVLRSPERCEELLAEAREKRAEEEKKETSEAPSDAGDQPHLRAPQSEGKKPALFGLDQQPQTPSWHL